MLNKVSKRIFGMLISVLCISGIGLNNSSYELKSYAVTSEITSDWKNHWAKAEIESAMNKGWVDNSEVFRPNDSITRGEFVKIFNKVFGLTTTSEKVFSDTQTHWAKTEIDIAVTNGVCKGKTATEFKPNDPITREEAAVMISNYKKLSDANYDELNKYMDKSKISSWAMGSVEGIIQNGYMGGYSDGTFKPKGKITRAEAVVTLSRVSSNTRITPAPAGKSNLPIIEGANYADNELTYSRAGYSLAVNDESEYISISCQYAAYEVPPMKEALKTSLIFYLPSSYSKALSMVDAAWENGGSSSMVGDGKNVSINIGTRISIRIYK